uniref:Putative Patched family protein n=1 Tax=uncultured marine microorganism HF4000_APKG10F17 TaxID=455558 RepID=B3TBZ3_9ZZZZ|nr:putative Patched family protein [uncultured marine microorganism HF4000_APKG10F17]
MAHFWSENMLLQKIGEIVIKKPLAIVVGVIVITILMVAQMALNPQDGTVSQSSFLPDNEVISALEDIGDKFVTEYPVDILVYSKNDDILTSDAFVEILEIEIALIENELITNNSLTPSNPSTDLVAIPNYLAPFVEGDASDLQQLKDIYANKTDQEIKDAFNAAKQNPLLAGAVINILGEYDGDNSTKATKITFKFDNSQREGEGTAEAFDRMVSVELEMDDVVKGMEFESVEAHALGQAVLDNAINEASDESMDQLFILVIILVIGVLFATFRSPVDVGLTMFALMMAIIWSKGFASLLQFEPSFFAVIVPILLVGLGVDYGIHLVMRYREELVEDWNIDKASSSSIMFVGSALLLATTTTMVGFLSNVASDLTPIREFGIQVAIGVLSAFLIFVTFIPACRILIDRRYEAQGKKLLSDTNEKIIRGRKEEGEQTGILDNFMALGAKVAIENPQRVLAVVAVITLITGYAALGISTEFNFNDFLPEEVEITEHFHYLQDEFSSSNEFSFIYISGSVATFDVFNQINNTQVELSDGDDWVNPDQSMMFSPLNGMRDLASNDSDINPFDFYNATFEELFNSNDADGDRVPDSDEGVRELLDWIMIGDGKEVPNMVSNFIYYDEETEDYTVAYILVNTKSKNAYFSEVVEELEKDSEGLETLETEGKVDSVVVTGFPAIIEVVVNTINATMMGSIIYTIILSFIILTAIFGYTDKQPWLGPLTMIPVLLVLVWILGTMVAIGYALNVFTILIGALTVGLGVTYAIHISHRFIEEMEHHHSLEKAVNNTVKNTGSALFGAAMTTVLGFGVLFFAILPPMKQFGTMTALTIFYSFLSSVWVLPSILVLWARYTDLGKVVDEQQDQDDVEEEESDEEEE